MVIRIPDFSGDLHTKGRIIVPCQCLYSPNYDFLTEIHHHRTKSHPNSNHNPKIGIRNHFHTIYEPNEFSELWKRQFNRWWGWNWQRKRKDFLRKFGIKTTRIAKTGKSNIREEATYSHCSVNPRLTKSDDSNRLNRNNNYSKFNSNRFAPLPPFYTCGLRKPYEGRRRRRKLDQREYQSWLRENTSSDSDPPVRTAERAFKDRTIGQQCSYLQKRLDHLVSDDDPLDECSTSMRMQTDYNNLEFQSPISGKIYDLSQPQLVTCASGECNNVKYLDTVSLKSDSFIPKFEFEWLEKYKLMKEDHTELIATICEIICASHHNTGKKDIEEPSNKDPVGAPDNTSEIYCASHFNTGINEKVENTSGNKRSAPKEPNSPHKYTDNFSEIFCASLFKSGFENASDTRSAPEELNNAPEIDSTPQFETGSAPNYFELHSTENFPDIMCATHFKSDEVEEAPGNKCSAYLEPKRAPECIGFIQTESLARNQNLQYFEKFQNTPKHVDSEPNHQSTKRESFDTLFLCLDNKDKCLSSLEAPRRKKGRSESYAGRIMPKVYINQPRSDSYLMRNTQNLNIVNDDQSQDMRQCESILLANSCYEDALESDYDLNYIENHLSSFTSFISDIEFIVSEDNQETNE